MSLSFREQAAIAYATAYRAPTEERTGFVLDQCEAAEMAQDLANECCEHYGHDYSPISPGGEWRQPFTATQTDKHVCYRCGKERQP